MIGGAFSALAGHILHAPPEAQAFWAPPRHGLHARRLSACLPPFSSASKSPIASPPCFLSTIAPASPPIWSLAPYAAVYPDRKAEPSRISPFARIRRRPPRTGNRARPHVTPDTNRTARVPSTPTPDGTARRSQIIVHRGPFHPPRNRPRKPARSAHPLPCTTSCAAAPRSIERESERLPPHGLHPPPEGGHN